MEQVDQFPKITMAEIQWAIDKLRNDKVTGTRGIRNETLVNCHIDTKEVIRDTFTDHPVTYRQVPQRSRAWANLPVDRGG